jgi:hypothetical protein
MFKKIINEGLDFHDFVGQIEPYVSVDEYSAKIGEDSEIVTLAFTVSSEQAGIDLADWFEKGYDFVLDAQVSEGEDDKGKFLVFVEMDRRSKVPNRIIELLDDLETLTALPISDWSIIVDGKEYTPEEKSLKQAIICSPHEYRMKIEREEDLNEMREIAGLPTKAIFKNHDKELKTFKNLAGL